MVEVRPAVVADTPELVRLRAVMLAGMHGAVPEPGPWQELAARTLRRRLGDGSLAAFVVDRPDPAAGPVPGPLVACAVGAVESRLGDPGNPTGESGYVFNVATEPGYRRRGYARACVRRLLEWYRERGIAVVDLRPSPDGEALYRSLGFAPSSTPVLRLDNRNH